MNILKLSFVLTFTLFGLTVNTATEAYWPSISACKPLELLNKTTRSNLQLNDTEMKLVSEINRQYWSARKQIIKTPEMIGQNTALLSCWDDWRISLKKQLSEVQMKKFMEWQAEVDLLSKTPF